MMAPPRSRWRSAVPEAMPARVTGTEPVSECDAGVPANPTPAPIERVAEPDHPVGAALVPQQEHGDEAEQAAGVADQQGEPGAARFDELRRAGCDQHHHHHRREDRCPGLDRRVVEHVLQVLLADEHRPHQRAEHDQPGAGGDPERAPAGDVQVVERRRGSALADDEGDRRRRPRWRPARRPAHPRSGPGRS